MPPADTLKRPSKEAVRARMRQLQRSPDRASGPATLGDCFGQLFEMLALRKLLTRQRDALEVAEQLSPGILARMERFATEGGR